MGSWVISPLLSLNAASSNGLTIIPLPKSPKSPPRFALPLSIDNCLARFEKLSPFLRRSNIITASLCFFTSMWEHLILSAKAFEFLPPLIGICFYLNKYITLHNFAANKEYKRSFSISILVVLL